MTLVGKREVAKWKSALGSVNRFGPLKYWLRWAPRR